MGAEPTEWPARGSSKPNKTRASGPYFVVASPVRLHSVTISGDTATTAFNASAFDWTVTPQRADGTVGVSLTEHFP